MPTSEVIATQYIPEYMAAVDRTQALGFEPPIRLIVHKNCVDMKQVRPVVLAYFDRHKPKELLGQTLAIHFDLVPLLFKKTGVPFELTIGWVVRDGRAHCQHDEEKIRRFMREKMTAYNREGVPFHLWLTAPSFEVVDVTFALNIGWAKNRTECNNLIVYQNPNAPVGKYIYHPMIVGPDFFIQSGAAI